MKTVTTQQFYKILDAGPPICPKETSEIIDFPTPRMIRKIDRMLVKAREEVGARHIRKDKLVNILANTSSSIDKGRTRFLLEYDKGIAIKAESACKVMKERERPCDIWGWAGQFAFDGHLEEYKVKRTHDDPHYFPDPDDCDFRIDFGGKENRIEVKTTRPGVRYRECRVYKTKTRWDGSEIEVWHRPDYVIAVKSLNQAMTQFKIYGWMTWRDVEKHGDFQTWSEGSRWGIPLDSPAIRDYSVLLGKINQAVS